MDGSATAEQPLDFKFAQLEVGRPAMVARGCPLRHFLLFAAPHQIGEHQWTNALPMVMGDFSRCGLLGVWSFAIYIRPNRAPRLETGRS